LVSFLQGDEPKIGLIKNEDGKYLVPNEILTNGENCYTAADRLVNTSCSLDKTTPFSIRLIACLTGQDFISLVFVLDTKSDTTFNDEILFLSGEEASKAYFEKGFFEEYGEVVKAAIENG